MKRYIVMTFLLAFAALCAVAQGNRVYIDDFEIYPDSTVTVPVVLANVEQSRGLQFHMSLPEGLTVKKYELTDHSLDCDMKIIMSSDDAHKNYKVLLYSLTCSFFPCDTAAIMMIRFKADPGFKGGSIVLRKVNGSTMENKMLHMPDNATIVTVPEAELIGIPIDSKTSKDGFFN